MDNSNYPRPDQMPSGPYPPDRTWGIVIIVFSVLGICAGGCLMGIGGLAGVFGGAAASTAAAAGNNRDAASAATAAAAGGGLAMAVGIGLMVLSAARLYAGFLIMNSKRLGFMIAGACSAISILISLASLPSSILGIVISGVVIYYCAMRVTGKQGPPVIG